MCVSWSFSIWATFEIVVATTASEYSIGCVSRLSTPEEGSGWLEYKVYVSKPKPRFDILHSYPLAAEAGPVARRRLWTLEVPLASSFSCLSLASSNSISLSFRSFTSWRCSSFNRSLMVFSPFDWNTEEGLHGIADNDSISDAMLEQASHMKPAPSRFTKACPWWARSTLGGVISAGCTPGAHIHAWISFDREAERLLFFGGNKFWKWFYKDIFVTHAFRRRSLERGIFCSTWVSWCHQFESCPKNSHNKSYCSPKLTNINPI